MYCVFILYLATIFASAQDNYELQVTNQGKWRFINITCLNNVMTDSNIEDKVDRSLSKQLTNVSTEEKDEPFPNQYVTLEKSVIRGSTDIHTLINCQKMVLQNNAVDTDVNSLYVSSTGILELYSDWISPNSNLTILKLISDNELIVPTDCSWLPPSLRILDVSHFTFNPKLLDNCQGPIEKLSVAGANLETLNLCLPELKNLDASWNQLSTIEPSNCSNKVEELMVSHNVLKNWSSCGWPKLTHLIVDHNNITNMDFSECINDRLIHINAQHNYLQEIPGKLPESLSELDLSFNKIRMATPIKVSLKVLDLSHNLLEDISKEAFRWTWQLLTLDLSHNHLESFKGKEFLELRGLRSLDLSHNSIHHIQHKTFTPLQQLEELRINGNNLKQLDARLIADFPNHMVLNAHDNPWACSCHLLASLAEIERRKCTPHCNKKSKLKCKEQNAWIRSQILLRQCLLAIQEVSKSPYQNIPGSDEDISEEQTEMTLYAAPSGILILLLLISAALSYKAYLERNVLKRKLRNCLKSDTTTSWSSMATTETIYVNSETNV